MGKVKKLIRICIFFIAFLCKPYIIGCAEENVIYYYDMGIKEKDYIVKNLNRDNLYNLRGSVKIYKLCKNDTQYICTCLENEEVLTDEDEIIKTISHNGEDYISRLNFKYIDAIKVKNFIKNSYANCVIYDISLINLRPLIFFVHTNKGDMLLETDEDCNFHFITQQALEDELSLKQTGLFFESSGEAALNALIKPNESYFIPIRAIINEYTDELLWDADSRTISFSFNGDAYELQLNEDSTLMYEIKNHTFIKKVEVLNYNGAVYLDNITTYFFMMDVFGKDCFIDASGDNVYIMYRRSWVREEN